MTDGYTVYTTVARVYGLTHAGCWTHARRKYDEALKAMGGKTKAKGGKAMQGLSYLRKLYAVERLAQGLSPEERHVLRQEKSRPVIEEARFAKLETVKWNVRIQERYAHGQGVAHYLARYLRGGPIGNSRLLPSPPGKVAFKYYNNHDKEEAGRGKPAIMTLPAEEFLRRLLLHIPPPRMVTIRSCGLYATTKSEALNACRALLGQAPAEKPAKPTWQDLAARCGDQHPECCPVCGRRLVVGEIVEPRRGTVVRLPQPRSGAPPDRTPRRKAA